MLIPNPSHFVPTEEAVYFPLTMTNFISCQLPLPRQSGSNPLVSALPPRLHKRHLYEQRRLFRHLAFPVSSGASALYITSTVRQALLQTPSSVLGKPAVPKLDEFWRFSDTTKFIVDFLTHWGLNSKSNTQKLSINHFPPEKFQNKGEGGPSKAVQPIRYVSETDGQIFICVRICIVDAFILASSTYFLC